ncbi:cation:dicarboxylase symporter family transporter [Elizabethkingia ursingii]|uniref:cation:dicarboxylate symporter family transporter n=1 Tax=Elizabethkingia ursingii TaxID=1756150 RepID=UPI00201364BA|nr:cation:dicarboxylase symporter family transporter [Elizabethkingia ursingii]MCL1668544.1 cation:dicarboxylase symporter family transporter [Elizabethkingia ursingii]
MSTVFRQKTFSDKYVRSLSLYVFAAIICGALTGYYFPEVSKRLRIVSYYFFQALELLIVPVIFIATTYGVSYVFSIQNAFRIIVQMICYFLLITTISIVLGFGFGFLLKPGADTGIDVTSVGKYLSNSPVISYKGLLYINNYMILILLSIVGGIVINFFKNKNKILLLLDNGREMLYRLIKYLYFVLPIVVFCNIAYSISVYGINTLLPLSKLVATVYLACIVFIVGILGIVSYLFKINLWEFLISIKEEIVLVLATSSSKTAFPMIFEEMESQGYNRKILRFIIPLGYNFNLAGACIYLSIACIFLIQLYNIHLEYTDYIWLFIVVSIASKTASGVPGSGFLALVFTLDKFGKIPMSEIALLYSIDRFMNEARAVTNFIGIAVGGAIISKINQKHINI